MKILLLLILLTATVFAKIGKISSLLGSCAVARQNETMNGTVGLDLEEKDVLSTKENSKLQVVFNDGTVVTIGKLSTFDIAAYVYDEAKSDKSKADFGFLEGSFKSVTGQIGKIAPDKFNLKTKTATIGIRGTTIVGNQEAVACTQGEIAISSNGVTQIVPAGMFSKTPPNAPPTPPAPYVAGSIGDVEVESTPAEEKKEEKKEDKKAVKEDKKEDDKKEDKPSDGGEKSDKKEEKSSGNGEKNNGQGSTTNSKEESPANSSAESTPAIARQENSPSETPPNTQPQTPDNGYAALDEGTAPSIDSRSLARVDAPLPSVNNAPMSEQPLAQPVVQNLTPDVQNITPNIQNIVPDIQNIIAVVQASVDTEAKVVAETEAVAVVVTPTEAPTTAPTTAPTEAPTTAPTEAPTTAPTEAPTTAPTEAPTTAPTEAPTTAPTEAPTTAPTEAPTTAPTEAPTTAPTEAPTTAPTEAPTTAPTEAPTTAPTEAPTTAPTEAPTTAPTEAPTTAPTEAPTTAPTEAPTTAPTEAPTTAPTEAPTTAPTEAPTTAPTEAPTTAPTEAPTTAPTEAPTTAPTEAPTTAPTEAPTDAPTDTPTVASANPPTLPVTTTTISSSTLNDIASATADLTKTSSYGDEYLEYGYWDNVSIINGSDASPSAFSYISGVVTPSDYVNQMITTGGIATYSGGVSAIVTNTSGAKTASDGTVALDFYFGTQVFEGNINVADGTFEADVAGNVHKYGFDSTSVTGITTNVTGGKLNGQFYGDTAQAAGGQFNLSGDAGSVSGVFGATKYVPPAQ